VTEKELKNGKNGNSISFNDTTTQFHNFTVSQQQLDQQCHWSRTEQVDRHRLNWKPGTNKLLWRAYRKSSTLFRFFGSPPYSYFWFRLYSHRDGRFCLIFARTARQSVLDGTNGLSSSKPCEYCWTVQSE